MQEYLETNHKNDLLDILNNSEDALITSIYVNLTHLQQTNLPLFNDVINNVHEESVKWSNVLLEMQKQIAEVDEFLEPNYEIKVDARVRFVNLPEQDIRHRTTFPTNVDTGEFVQMKGTVLRCTQPKFLEHKKDFLCGRCKNKIAIQGEYAKYYVISPPMSCPNACKGKPYLDETNIDENVISYQEIKIMEVLTNKSMPAAMIVTLDNDLVDNCQPGDSVTICGTVESRYTFGKTLEIKVVIRANSITNEMKKFNIGSELPEHLICLRAEWNEFTEKFGELGARDIIIQSICPDVHGMYLAKLAVALAICSGFDASSTVSGLRNHSHVLLIGDPGLAKSRLLKFASSVASRSSFITGSGCTSAGLTAAAVQENGEWHLEAGALPLADNGICCIDEFNLMSESDKESLHEAMEQQTLHISKAGIACKLNTRCAIIAATNPKNLYSMSEQEGTSTINLGLASSLLSRFDLVFVLRDERNEEWDNDVAKHILFETGPVQHERIYDLNQLQAHFSAVRDFDPVVTEGASRILKAYYLACRADQERDAGRTTLRLNDSLYRLAKAHAKLLFRHEVTEIDAVLIVMLMESSFGFGRILEPLNLLRKDIPLGPSNVQIEDLMEKLNLEPRNTTNRDNDTNNIRSGNVISSLRDNLVVSVNEVLRSQAERSSHVGNSRREVFDANKFAFKRRKLCAVSAAVPDENSLTTTVVVENANTSEQLVRESERTQQSQGVLQTLFPTQNMEPKPSTVRRRRHIDIDVDELDRIFTLDDPVPSVSNIIAVDPVPLASHIIAVNNVVTDTNVCVETHSNDLLSNPQNEQQEDTSQTKRRRMYGRCTDEDLAALDDFDF